MLTVANPDCDGVRLAHSIRSLASRARRILTQSSGPGEVRELLDDIEAAERMSLGRSSPNLTRWLSSLRRRVERDSGPYY